MQIRVILADDQQIFLEGLKNIFEKDNIEVVATTCSGKELIELAKENRCPPAYIRAEPAGERWFGGPPKTEST
jgi:DNA-binding NarL/FixJ family response regulator